MDTPEISVVVLAYRSAATITNFVDSLIDSLEKENLLWEIVLVGNYFYGVGDQTPEVVRGIAARDSRIKAVVKIKKGMRDELLNLYKELSPYPEVKECLEGLKSKKIKIAILSNGTPDLLKGLVESNNIQNYFDDIMSIEVVGIYKPDSKVYEMPIKKYDCKPENICFMSSNTWDVSGGGVFGYNAVWVNRFNKVFDKLSYKPPFVINNLNELLEIV